MLFSRVRPWTSWVRRPPWPSKMHSLVAWRRVTHAVMLLFVLRPERCRGEPTCCLPLSPWGESGSTFAGTLPRHW